MRLHPLAVAALAAAPSSTAAPQEGRAPRAIALPTNLERPVLVDDAGGGLVHAVGATWKASFGADGVVFVPFLGSDAPRNYPVRFRLADADLAGALVERAPARASSRGAGRVAVDHGTFQEVWHLGTDLVEQTFVFESLPERGALTLALDVETDLARRVEDGALVFENERGGVRYGAAVALDAVGRTTPVERVETARGLELRVPEAFVREAVLPLVVDPIVTTTGTLYDSPNEQRNADVSYGHAKPTGVTVDEYFVVWEEVVSATDSDIYGIALKPDGTIIDPSFCILDSSLDAWRDPKVAFLRETERFFVVAERRAQNASISQIHGRARRMTINFVEGPIEVAANAFANLNHPDIGGDAGSTGSFLVAYERRFGQSGGDIIGAVLDGFGAPVVPYVAISEGPEDDSYPDVARNTGAAFFGFRWHNVVWSRDLVTAAPTVQGRRVTLGASAMTAPFLVSLGSYPGYRASASQTRLGPAMQDGSLPFLVSYRADVNSPELLYLRLCGNQGPHGGTNLSFSQGMEAPLEPRLPRVADMTIGFAVAYTNVAGGGSDARVDMGNISYNGNYSGWYGGLGERRLPVADATEGPEDLALATVSEGGLAQDDGIVVWSRNGAIEAALLEAPGSFSAPVLGLQTCNALPNSTGERGWITALGAPDAIGPKTVLTESLPANQFGYLLCSRKSGSVLPPGSEGRLCLGGDIGRFVDQVQSTGPDGTMSFLVFPQALPQPGGFEAASAGEVWYFQAWHRDVSTNGTTSNFTNALLVTFL